MKFSLDCSFGEMAKGHNQDEKIAQLNSLNSELAVNICRITGYIGFVVGNLMNEWFR